MVCKFKCKCKCALRVAPAHARARARARARVRVYVRVRKGELSFRIRALVDASIVEILRLVQLVAEIALARVHVLDQPVQLQQLLLVDLLPVEGDPLFQNNLKGTCVKRAWVHNT